MLRFRTLTVNGVKSAVPPRVLILDASGRPCRVGLADGTAVISSETLDDTRRHARDLAGAVRRLLDTQGWSVKEIGLIAVASGPGSFTGIRVAVSFAKSIHFATGCQMAGIDAFDLAMAPYRTEPGPVRVAVNFQLGTLLSAVYVKDTGTWHRGPIQSWNGQPDIEAAWTGPALTTVAVPDSVRVLGTTPWATRLEDLGAIAVERWQANATDDVWQLEPFYVRPSSAEEMWDARRS